MLRADNTRVTRDRSGPDTQPRRPDASIPYSSGEGSITDPGVQVVPGRLQGMRELPGGVYLNNRGNVVDGQGNPVAYDWDLRKVI